MRLVLVKFVPMCYKNSISIRKRLQIDCLQKCLEEELWQKKQLCCVVQLE